MGKKTKTVEQQYHGDRGDIVQQQKTIEEEEEEEKSGIRTERTTERAAGTVSRAEATAIGVLGTDNNSVMRKKNKKLDCNTMETQKEKTTSSPPCLDDDSHDEYIRCCAAVVASCFRQPQMLSPVFTCTLLSSCIDALAAFVGTEGRVAQRFFQTGRCASVCVCMCVCLCVCVYAKRFSQACLLVNKYVCVCRCLYMCVCSSSHVVL